jgi:glutamyl-tRNA synthetase
VQDRLKTLADLPTLTDYFFTEPEVDWELAEDSKPLRKLTPEDRKKLLKKAHEALAASEFDPETLQTTLNQLLETTGQKPAALFSLIRLAVSWAPFSPALNDTLTVIGKEKTLARLQKAIDSIL